MSKLPCSLSCLGSGTSLSSPHLPLVALSKAAIKRQMDLSNRRTKVTLPTRPNKR